MRMQQQQQFAMVGGFENTPVRPFDQGVSSGLERCWRRTRARQDVAVVVDVFFGGGFANGENDGAEEGC
jgi:hypothetical protein